MTENCKPSVPGTRPRGPSPRFQPRPRAGAPASPSPPGARPRRAPLSQVARPRSWVCPGTLPTVPGPGAPPSTFWPAAPLPTAQAPPPRRPHPARIPVAAPGVPRLGGARCGRVGPRPHSWSLGPPRASAAVSLTHLRAATWCVAELLQRRSTGWGGAVSAGRGALVPHEAGGSARAGT